MATVRQCGRRVSLRGADLRGDSFHLGSTRNGLVGSPITCQYDPEQEAYFRQCGAICRPAPAGRSNDLRKAAVERRMRRCREGGTLWNDLSEKSPQP
jgi:hypothetical protein